jgi:hypothetical protein
MTKKLWLLLVLFVLASATIFAMSVHDVQYTTIPGDGTYPSTKVGQTVTINNVVVTAKGYSGSTIAGDKWFVSDLDGGPWSGLYVYDFSYAPSILVGDIVNVTGVVSEYFGLTELGSVSAVEVVSHGNLIPAPISLPTSTFTPATNNSAMESYESSLVQVQNVRVTAGPSATYYEWYVTDQTTNTQTAQIDDGFIIGFSGLTPTPFVNETFVKIRGMVDYGHNEFAINPRFLTDIIQSITVGTAQITIPNVTASNNSDVPVSITTTALDPVFNVKKFSFKLTYDPQRLEILGGVIKNTILESTGIDSLTLLSDLEIVQDSTTLRVVYVSFESDSVLTSTADDEILVTLLVRTKMNGNSPLTVTDFKYNTTSLNAVTSGSVNIPFAKKQAFMNIYNRSYVNSPKYTLNRFDPRAEKITIDFGGKSNGLTSPANFKGILRIYDSQGRLMTTLVSEIIQTTTGIRTVDWDGRDSEGNMVPIGLYYCHAEIIDRANGDQQSVVQPIVVGTPLK